MKKFLLIVLLSSSLYAQYGPPGGGNPSTGYPGTGQGTPGSGIGTPGSGLGYPGTGQGQPGGGYGTPGTEGRATHPQDPIPGEKGNARYPSKPDHRGLLSQLSLGWRQSSHFSLPY
jgi:hypothetical protein